MKKNPISLILLLIIPVFSIAQLVPHLLSSTLTGFGESTIGDIDGDGDMDIFFIPGGIASPYWFEQIDIVQNEWELHSLGSADGNGNLDLIDVDNDDDLDFVIRDEGKIEYWENLNSLGTEIINHEVFQFSTLSLWEVTGLVDLDNDGDLDLVSDGVAWAENIDGHFSFGDEQIIYQLPEEHKVSFNLNFFDVDGDSNIDIILNMEVAASINQIKVIRNLGSGLFSDPEILVDSFPSWNRAFTRVADVDNDDDIDIIVHNGPEDIVWFRNESGNFGSPIFIHEYFDIPADLEIVDINNDGLPDIFWCGHGGVFWKPNKGDFKFDVESIPLGPNTVNKATSTITFGDLDKDGDLDMLSMGVPIQNFPQYFRWYENKFPILNPTLDDIEESSLDVFPNPFSNTLQINTPFKVAEIYNSQGVKIVEFEIETLDLSTLKSGIYFLRVALEENDWAFRRIVKVD